MPSREISRSLGPSRRRSMTLGNVDRLADMPLLRAEEETKVREWFAELERPVELRQAVSSAITWFFEQEPEGFPRFPAVSIRPDGRDAGVRYDGLPWGYELGSLVGAIVEAGREEPTLRPDSLAALEQLDRDLALEVFVTPT